jgi:hypothetical protein
LDKNSFMLKEIAQYRRFKSVSTQDRSIVFYAEHSGYYPYFEGIIKKLTYEYDRSICYVTSDRHDPILAIADPRIKAFYLNKLLPLFMAFVDCKVFVMTLMDLGNFHLKRSINPVHYVYVFHGLFSTHMVLRPSALDHYDALLCAGPHQVEEIRQREKLNSLPPKTLIEAGYYPLERIYQYYQEYASHRPPQADKETILVASSWGVDNVLESCGEELIGLLLREGYLVIVRPHPETTKRSPRLIRRLEERFGNDPNFTLEKSVAIHDSLSRADILITDWSSISLEYAFGTERPVLFLDVPAKIRNPKYEELGIEPIEISLRPEIGIVISPDSLNTVPQTITEIMANQAGYKEHLAELRNRYVYRFGNSADTGAAYIVNIVGQSN